MSGRVELTASELRVLLRRMCGTHGKDAAVAWLAREWAKQPEAMFDCFILSGEHEPVCDDVRKAAQAVCEAFDAGVFSRRIPLPITVVPR